MAPGNNPEDTIIFVLTVLKNTDMPKPNYQDIAKEVGISNTKNAEKRFKKLVEEAGFALVDGKVTLPGPLVANTTPETSKSRTKKTGGNTPASEKRKLAVKEEVDEGEGVVHIKEEVGASTLPAEEESPEQLIT